MKVLPARLVFGVVDADAGVDAEEFQVFTSPRTRSKIGLSMRNSAESVSALGVLAQAIALVPARLIQLVPTPAAEALVLAGAIADRRQFGCLRTSGWSATLV